MASMTNNARELSRLQTWDQSEVTRPAPVEAQVRPGAPGGHIWRKEGGIAPTIHTAAVTDTQGLA
jgi:hypothetical protein